MVALKSFDRPRQSYQHTVQAYQKGIMFTIGQFDGAKNATVATLNSKKIKIVSECEVRKDSLAADNEDEDADAEDAGSEVDEQDSVLMDEDEVAASDASTVDDLDATETVDVSSVAALRVQLDLAKIMELGVCLLALGIIQIVV